MISRSTLSAIHKKSRLKPLKTRLTDFQGRRVPVAGSCRVNVTFGSRRAWLPVVVVEGPRPSLLGLDWFRKLGISIARIDGQHAAPPRGRLAENRGGVRRHTGVLQGTACLHPPGSGRLLHPPKGSSGPRCVEGRVRHGARPATSSRNPWSCGGDLHRDTQEAARRFSRVHYHDGAQQHAYLATGGKQI